MRHYALFEYKEPPLVYASPPTSIRADTVTAADTRMSTMPARAAYRRFIEPSTDRISLDDIDESPRVASTFIRDIDDLFIMLQTLPFVTNIIVTVCLSFVNTTNGLSIYEFHALGLPPFTHAFQYAAQPLIATEWLVHGLSSRYHAINSHCRHAYCLA